MRKRLKDYDRLVVFDVETTGFHPARDAIIDFGAIEGSFRGGRVETEKEHALLVRAEKPLPAKIVELTGITDELLAREGAESSRLIEKLAGCFTSGTLAVAYNLPFDLAFVLETLGIEPEGFPSDVLDLLTVFRDSQPYPHRLEHALSYYGLDNEGAHRAYHDAAATAKLLAAMHSDFDVSAYINHVGFHSRYGLKGPRLPHVQYHPQRYIIGEVWEQIKKAT